MLDLLPESKPSRVRRTGGMTTSVVLHVAIIGAITATTTQIPRATREPPPTVIPIAPIVETRVVTASGIVSTGAPQMPRIDPSRFVITDIPTKIPAIDLSQPATPDVGGAIDFGSPNGVTFGSRNPLAGTDTAGNGTWSSSETLMRIISPVRPRYPEALRGAGVSGRVTIQFTVDTTGRVEMASVKTLQSTHALFTRAVLDVLPSLRFLPTESNGRRVRALAEMPFEFVLK
jgi:protein TonB